MKAKKTSGLTGCMGCRGKEKEDQESAGMRMGDMLMQGYNSGGQMHSDSSDYSPKKIEALKEMPKQEFEGFDMKQIGTTGAAVATTAPPEGESKREEHSNSPWTPRTAWKHALKQLSSKKEECNNPTSPVRVGGVPPPTPVSVYTHEEGSLVKNAVAYIEEVERNKTEGVVKKTLTQMESEFVGELENECKRQTEVSFHINDRNRSAAAGEDEKGQQVEDEEEKEWAAAIAAAGTPPNEENEWAAAIAAAGTPPNEEEVTPTHNVQAPKKEEKDWDTLSEEKGSPPRKGEKEVIWGCFRAKEKDGAEKALGTASSKEKSSSVLTTSVVVECESESERKNDVPMMEASTMQNEPNVEDDKGWECAEQAGPIPEQAHEEGNVPSIGERNEDKCMKKFGDIQGPHYNSEPGKLEQVVLTSNESSCRNVAKGPDTVEQPEVTVGVEGISEGHEEKNEPEEINPLLEGITLDLYDNVYEKPEPDDAPLSYFAEIQALIQGISAAPKIPSSAPEGEYDALHVAAEDEEFTTNKGEEEEEETKVEEPEEEDDDMFSGSFGYPIFDTPFLDMKLLDRMSDLPSTDEFKSRVVQAQSIKNPMMMGNTLSFSGLPMPPTSVVRDEGPCNYNEYVNPAAAPPSQAPPLFNAPGLDMPLGIGANPGTGTLLHVTTLPPPTFTPSSIQMPTPTLTCPGLSTPQVRSYVPPPVQSPPAPVDSASNAGASVASYHPAGMSRPEGLAVPLVRMDSFAPIDPFPCTPRVEPLVLDHNAFLGATPRFPVNRIISLPQRTVSSVQRADSLVDTEERWFEVKVATNDDVTSQEKDGGESSKGSNKSGAEKNTNEQQGQQQQPRFREVHPVTNFSLLPFGATSPRQGGGLQMPSGLTYRNI